MFCRRGPSPVVLLKTQPWEGDLLKTQDDTRRMPRSCTFLLLLFHMTHPDIWKTNFSLALGNLRGLVEVWGDLRTNARLDPDLTGREWSVSLPRIFSTLGNPKIFILTLPSLRKELLEKCQGWQWLLLIGSSCLVVFHPPTHTAAAERQGRGAVLCYTEPLGAVLYRLCFSL